MGFSGIRMPTGVIFIILTASAFGYAFCPVDAVIVRGRVEHIPATAKVRVQLVYADHLGGDSGEATSVETNFTIPVEFVTQSRRALLVGTFREKCDRKPETVIVTLMGGSPFLEYDRVALDLTADFRKADSNTYTLKSELVLKGSR
jgi:hypothetical protein